MVLGHGLGSRPLIPSEPTPYAYGDRLMNRKNLLWAAAGGVVVLLASMLPHVNAQQAGTSRHPTSITAVPSTHGGTILYRLWSDGSVDKWLIRTRQNTRYNKGWVPVRN